MYSTLHIVKSIIIIGGRERRKKKEKNPLLFLSFFCFSLL